MIVFLGRISENEGVLSLVEFGHVKFNTVCSFSEEWMSCWEGKWKRTGRTGDFGERCRVIWKEFGPIGPRNVGRVLVLLLTA